MRCVALLYSTCSQYVHTILLIITFRGLFALLFPAMFSKRIVRNFEMGTLGSSYFQCVFVKAT